MKSTISIPWFHIVAGVFSAIAVLIALNLPTLELASAVAFSEKRPDLFSDATWNEPASAVRFYDRFEADTSDDKLVSWLEENEFVVDKDGHFASKNFKGLPCNEHIRVTWSVSDTGALAELKAIISESGCL